MIVVFDRVELLVDVAGVIVTIHHADRGQAVAPWAVDVDQVGRRDLGRMLLLLRVCSHWMSMTSWVRRVALLLVVGVGRHRIRRVVPYK